MLVSCRTSRILFQAVERQGLSPAKLTDPLGLAIGPLMDPAAAVSWETLARITAKLSELLGDDPKALQSIGRQMAYVPAYEPLRVIARSAVSLQRLYALAERWVAPANFPHLRLFQKELSPTGLAAHGSIPAQYAPSAPFFHIVIGTMVEMPILMGLPPAKVVEEHVEPRSFDLELELPAHESSIGRLVQGVAGLVRREGSRHALEEQRRELARGFETVQRARDELRAILEHLPDLVFIHDAGRIVFANRALVDVLGWSSSTALVGEPVTEIVDASSIEVVTRGPVERGAEGGSLEQAKFRRRDGHRVLVEVAPVREVVFGAGAARLVVGRDLRERERLHQRLAAADRLASVGVLAAGVAHEINNPLAYVLNNIELARNHATVLGAGASPVNEALGIALEGVDRIRAIVRELLQLARGDVASLGPTDARTAIESTLALARVEIGRTATLVKELAAVPPVRASSSRVAQIVLNLVLNALEAMRGRPATDNRLVIRLYLADADRVAIEVVDNGIGIGPAELPRLFDYFYTTKPAGLGTGLGLPITQRLVVELGGEILVESALEGGSTFRVLLPLAKDDDDVLLRG